jgi:hypothetical protein
VPPAAVADVPAVVLGVPGVADVPAAVLGVPGVADVPAAVMGVSAAAGDAPVPVAMSDAPVVFATIFLSMPEV